MQLDNRVFADKEDNRFSSINISYLVTQAAEETRLVLTEINEVALQSRELIPQYNSNIIRN